MRGRGIYQDMGREGAAMAVVVDGGAEGGEWKIDPLPVAFSARLCESVGGLACRQCRARRSHGAMQQMFGIGVRETLFLSNDEYFT